DTPREIRRDETVPSPRRQRIVRVEPVRIRKAPALGEVTEPALHERFTRHRVRQALERAPHRRRHAMVDRVDTVLGVALVAAEELVAAVARDEHLDAGLASETRTTPRGDDG